MKKKRWLILCACVIALYAFVLVRPALAQHVQQKEKTELSKELEGQGKIVPGPKNIRESTGIYVFVSWMWLCIVVLIFFLKLKIRELDRLLELRFLPAKKK